MVSWSIVLHCGIRVLPHHVIDGLHDVQHLLEEDEWRKISLRMQKLSDSI